MVEDVARLGTTQYGDDGRSSIPWPQFSISSYLVLSAVTIIESGRPQG